MYARHLPPYSLDHGPDITLEECRGCDTPLRPYLRETDFGIFSRSGYANGIHFKGGVKIYYGPTYCDY